MKCSMTSKESLNIRGSEVICVQTDEKIDIPFLLAY